MDFSDEQLDYIRKNPNLSIQSLSKKLNLTEEEVSIAIEGLGGSERYDLSANAQTWGHIYFYPFVLFYFVYSVYLKQDFVDYRTAFIWPCLLLLFGLFFLGAFIKKSILIRNSPFDLPLYCFGLLFLLLSLGTPYKNISLYNMSIGLFVCLFYFLQVNATKESFNIRIARLTAWLTFLFAILDFEKTKFMAIVALPFLICFAIYEQKKNFFYFYCFVIPLLYLKCIYSNDLLLIFFTFITSAIYLITVYIIKVKTNETITRSPRLKIGAIVAVCLAILISLLQAIGFSFNSNPLSSHQFIFFLSSNSYIKEYFLTHLNFINEPIDLALYFQKSTYVYFISVAFCTILLFFSVKSIKQADCFSEKIYAAINIPLSLYLVLLLAFSVEIPMFEFLFILNLLAFQIARQVFHSKLENGHSVNIKKEVYIMKTPSIIFGSVLLLYSLWFIWDSFQSL